jgi:hypothetical protein
MTLLTVTWTEAVLWPPSASTAITWTRWLPLGTVRVSQLTVWAVPVASGAAPSTAKVSDPSEVFAPAAAVTLKDVVPDRVAPAAGLVKATEGSVSTWTWPVARWPPGADALVPCTVNDAGAAPEAEGEAVRVRLAVEAPGTRLAGPKEAVTPEGRPGTAASRVTASAAPAVT